MIEKDAWPQTKLQQLTLKLATQHKVQDTINILNQITIQLKSIKIEQVFSPKDMLQKYLKPISKQLTNINVRIFTQARAQLEALLILIVQLQAKLVRFRSQVLGLQLLQELLDRNTELLKKSDLIDEMEELNLQIKSQIQIDFQWIVVRNAAAQKNTLLFYRCINIILDILNGFQQSFATLGMSLIRQYISFLIKISSYIKHDKLVTLTQKCVTALQSLIVSSINAIPPKQYTAQSIKSVSEMGMKLSNQFKKSQIKKRFDMLSSIYGLTFLSSNSIQKKINGLKIINKQSEYFYRSGSSILKQQQYIAWLLNNKVIDMIYEQSSSQTSIIKNCNYIFRIYFKRRCLKQANFIKMFDYLQQTNTQNRQFVLRQLDLESIRLESSEYEIFINKLQTINKPQFFQQDFFSICTQCIRYCTNNMIKQYITAVGRVLKKFHRKFRNQKIQHRCLKCYVKAITRLFQKDNDGESNKKYLLQIYDLYFGEQLTELGILLIKNIIEQLPEHSQISKSKLAYLLIIQKNAILNGLKFLRRKDISLGLRVDIQQYLCTLLKFTQDLYGNQKIQFNSDLLLQAVHSPKMFQKLSIFMSLNEKLSSTFDKLLTQFQVEENIPFSCIKSLFCRINFIYMRQITQLYQPIRFQLFCKVSDLKFAQNLKYLILNATSSQNRTLITDFYSDLYSFYSESKSIQGEKQLQMFLRETLQMTLIEYKIKQSQTRLLGYLALIQSMMMVTQLIGVGRYRPHNSLVPISTVQIKIMNEATYGNDVSQSFWKKVSSNMTLFDLLTQMGQKFRCSPCQLIIQQGQKFWPQKWNGLTLQELRIDDKFMKVIKSSRQRIRKENLIEDGQLTLKAKRVFQDIYNTFAVDGKMGKKQCSNFVAAVTKTPSSVADGRVQEFFKEYDLDKDQNITLQDFLRFYKHHCNPQRDDIVWKNLNNMRFRKDLKKYDDPIEIGNQNLLFRSILLKCEEFYNILFSLSQSNNKQLQERSKRLLLRLPTFPKTLESVKSNLDLISKNCFQTQYLLIAIQSKLNSEDLKVQQKQKNQEQFIQSGNFLQIFQMMIRIDNMQSMNENQRKCLYISLQIERSLLKVPNLKSTIKSDSLVFVNLKLPETYLFKKMQQIALKHIDIDIFEAALALQLTQTQKQIEFCLSSVFHDEIGIRKICCNYIFVLYQLNQVKIDLFQMEQKGNCQYWFQTLTKICALDNTINYSSVIKKCLHNIKNRAQSVQKNIDDPIIYGNLSIIQSILSQNKKGYEDISNELIDISQIILSNRTRKLVYSILSYFDVYFAIQFVSHLIDSVEPVKQIEPKKFYVGIKNLGSTCYMNSILQVLFCVDEFKNLVLSLPQEKIIMSQVNGKEIFDSTLYQLQKMYTNFIISTKKFYNPEQFCLTIKNGSQPINVKIQEDAHQFAGKFLDKLEKQVQKTDKIDVFRQLLQGNTVTQVVCKRCSNKIMREQKFSQISLAVKDLKNLEQSFQKYIFPEEIQDYFCQICNCRVQKIQKSTYISKLPKLLTINLQRIIYDLQTLMFKKIDTNFTFPQDLNIFNYVLKESSLSSQDCQYKLKAIIVHSGTSESGHYYSIIRIDKDWFKFNDQTVTKIEFKDIHHECFGGADSKQQWNDDLKFSTNAYMLFYESKSITLREIQCNLNQNLVQEIKKQNQKFYKQLQVHQESIFIFANEVYEKFVPKDIDVRMRYSIYEQNWNKDANVQYYQAIYQFSVRLLKFSTVFYDIKNQIVFKIGQNIFKLFFLLPQKSYQFLTRTSPDEFIDNMCLHNDQTIRNIYGYLLYKSIHVFVTYYRMTLQSQQQGTLSVIKILDCLFAFLQDQRMQNNIGKSYQYFDFWKFACQYIPIIVDYLIRNQMIVLLIDKLMPNDGPLLKLEKVQMEQTTKSNKKGDKNKKRSQLPVTCGTPITYLIVLLTNRKKNFNNYINPLRVYQTLTYYELTQKQRIVLRDVNFYQKMLQKKYDTGNLAILVSRLCEKDEKFSKEIAPVYLKGLNNVTYAQTGQAILNHIKFYLMIEDEFTLNRLKWILGIPQLRMGNQLVYGLTYQDQSIAYQYVSPLYFIKLQKDHFEPALAIMYDNHSTFNSFSIQGVFLLLNLMVSSQKAFKYVISLPAPSYLHRSYLDWIEKFLKEYKDSYTFQQNQSPNKHEVFQKFVSMYNHLNEKIQSQGINLPVNKKIIGRNKQLQAVHSVFNQQFKMTLWSHLTYTLPNEPILTQNKSMPKQLFKFGNPKGFAQYFISMSSQMLQPSNQLQSELTIYTLQVQTKQLLTIKFKLNNFNQQICVYKGKVFINFPYEPFEGDINTILEVKVMSKEQQMKEVQKMQQKQRQQINKDLMDFYSAQSMIQIQCRICTFFNNPHRKTCQMCDSAI